MTATSDRIRDVHFPKWLSLFEQKSREYGDTTHEELGPRAQFVDMNRKFVKLKRFMWDEPEDVPMFESVEEIIDDLIGHLFLTRDMMYKSKQEIKEHLQAQQYVGPAEVEAREMLEKIWAASDDDDMTDHDLLQLVGEITEEAHIKKIVGNR